MNTPPDTQTGPAALAEQIRALRNMPEARRLWRALVDAKGYGPALGTWRDALTLARDNEPTAGVTRAENVDLAEPRSVGRPRGSGVVGVPTRTIPATATRGPRTASAHIQVRLGEGQQEALEEAAARLVTSAAKVLRAAAARLLTGDIPAPANADQIPPALPSRGGEFPWIPGPGQLDQLTEMGKRLQDVLLPEGPSRPSPRGGRPGKPETEARDALLRYALDQHLDPTKD
jgi:hypothetical protein